MDERIYDSSGNVVCVTCDGEGHPVEVHTFGADSIMLDIYQSKELAELLFVAHEISGGKDKVIP
jgi:hypothetical protein